jgi:hypothetical protein
VSAAPYILALVFATAQAVVFAVFNSFETKTAGRIALDFVVAFIFPSAFVIISALVFGDSSARGPLILYAATIITIFLTTFGNKEKSSAKPEQKSK